LFGLPAAKLQVVNTLAHARSPWLASIEEVGDTEVVHALAPDAGIREVLIPSPYVARLSRVSAAVVAALRLALTQGGVVSFSGGTGEQCFTPAEVARVNSVLQTAQHQHVTMIFSTGDAGAATTACPLTQVPPRSRVLTCLPRTHSRSLSAAPVCMPTGRP